MIGPSIKSRMIFRVNWIPDKLRFPGRKPDQFSEWDAEPLSEAPERCHFRLDLRGEHLAQVGGFVAEHLGRPVAATALRPPLIDPLPQSRGDHVVSVQAATVSLQASRCQ